MQSTLDLHPALPMLRELAEIEAKAVKPTLADALRKGAQKCDQDFTGWGATDGPVCALSAAALAVKAGAV